MRVVVDTNVLISGLRSNSGPPGRILDAIVSGDLELVLSHQLRREFRRVLGRTDLSQVPGSSSQERSTFSILVAGLHAPHAQPAGTVRDPDDRHVLGAALHLGADVIVSGDKDLTVLGQFEGIPILTPRQFLDRLDALENSVP